MAASPYVFSELSPAGPDRARSGAPAVGRHRPAAACWAAAAGLALPLLLSSPAFASAPGEEGGAVVRRTADAPGTALALRSATAPAGGGAAVSVPALSFLALRPVAARPLALPPLGPAGTGPSTADPSAAGAGAADAGTAGPSTADATADATAGPATEDGPSAGPSPAGPGPSDAQEFPSAEFPSADPSAGAGGSGAGVPAPGPSPVPTTRAPSVPPLPSVTAAPGPGAPEAGPGAGHQGGPSAGPVPTAEPSPAAGPLPESPAALPSPAVQGPVGPPSRSAPPFADPARPGRDARHPVPDRLLPTDRAQAYRHHLGPVSPGPGGRFRADPPAAGGPADEEVAPAPPDPGPEEGAPQALAAGPGTVDVAGPVAAPTRWTDPSTLQLPLGAGLALIGSGLALVGLRMRRG
ncbi:hypothetical protein [Kitasatospora indigofera]|uniref:hypothetical protein n=1 Tax=Kitasatospora indigofera TaxID=67307 RepID=UPI0033ACED68